MTTQTTITTKRQLKNAVMSYFSAKPSWAQARKLEAFNDIWAEWQDVISFRAVTLNEIFSLYFRG
jgi:hypothetical protein